MTAPMDRSYRDSQAAFAKRQRFGRHGGSSHRSGVIAGREKLRVLMLPFGLWMIGQVMGVIEDKPDSAARGHVRPVYTLFVEPDELHMWVYRFREDVVRINLKSGAEEQSIPLLGVQLSTVAHSLDHSSALLCGADGTLVLFRNGQEAKRENLSAEAVDAALSDDGRVAVAATQCGQVRGWRWNGSELQDFAFNLESSSTILRIGLNSTGRRLLIAKSDGVVSFRDLDDPEHDESTLNVGAECVEFTWNGDESHIGAVTKDGELQIRQMATGRVVRRIRLDERSQLFIGGCRATISQDGRRVAVARTRTPEVLVWDVDTEGPVRRLIGHAGVVRSMQFSPDSQRLYTGSYDGTIRKWCLKTGSQQPIAD